VAIACYACRNNTVVGNISETRRVMKTKDEQGMLVLTRRHRPLLLEVWEEDYCITVPSAVATITVLA